MKLKLIGIAALSVFALSACSQMQPGAQSAKTAATGSAAGEASQNANAGLQHCPAPLGTVAIVEDTEAPWYGLLTGQYQLGSTVPVLKLLVQQSNCFVIVDRGRALGTAMGERALNASGELRKTSKMHKGQMVAADYTISPSVTFSNRDAGGGAAGLLAFVPVVGGVLAGAAGTMKAQEASTMLTLVDNRSSVQLAAAEGSARNVDFGMLSGVFAGGFGGAGAAGGGAYARTAQGKVVVAAFTDSLNNLVGAVRQYRAQNVKGGLGNGGALVVN
ncbi:peptidoglycan-binding protein [Caballeronia jiangsuensis]|nr:peptidoglycan-binding protein [Caballeronia jiangsuensis]